MVTIKAFGATDPGMKRSANHDAFSINETLKLYICCDGVSGHNGASEASSTCIESIQKFLTGKAADLKKLQDTSKPENRRQISELLEKSAIFASESIYKRAIKQKELAGMATTLDALLIVNDYAFLAHVGDGRIYLLRDGQAHQVTVDHNYATELVLKENKSTEEAQNHMYANVLTRAVGTQAAINVDILEVELSSDDIFLLCSDGLHHYYNNQELYKAMIGTEPTQATHSMIESAKKKGGHDNLTGVVIHVTKPEEKLAGDVREKILTIQKMDLFQFMDYPELIRILGAARLLTYAKGETIIKEGEEGDTMFVVVNGKISVMKGGQKISIGERGKSIGEMSLIESVPRSATVEALEDVTVLVFSRKELFAMFRTEVQIAVKFFWSLARDMTQRLRATTEKLAEAKMEMERLEKDLPFPTEVTSS